MKRLISILLLAAALFSTNAQAQCTSPNNSFLPGETLAFDLYFNWKFVWFRVGSATWSISDTRYAGQPSYRVRLITRGSKSADKYFVMRDTLVSYLSHQLTPLYYQKDATEGKQYRREKVWYTYPDGQCSLKMWYKRDDKPEHTKFHKSATCAYDMLSMMLRARSFDASKYQVGYRQKFLMAEGRHAEWRTLVYRGKKNVRMEGRSTTYRCLVFSYLENEKGKEREVVTFYVTDDENHLPVCLDMNLNFGSAKAYLSASSNLRHPIKALVKP